MKKKGGISIRSKSRSKGYKYLTDKDLAHLSLAAVSERNRALLYKRRLTADRIRSMASSLVQARQVLRKIAPAIEPELYASALVRSLKKDVNKAHPLGVTVDYLETARKRLLETLSFGRRLNVNVAGCGFVLAKVFRERTGRACWQWVGEILADYFPDALVATKAAVICGCGLIML